MGAINCARARNLGAHIHIHSNNERTIQLHHIFRGLIKALFIEVASIPPAEATKPCFIDPKCLLSPTNPNGIPVWKMFFFNWWPDAVGPLANNWTVNPEDYRLAGKGYAPNNYLGYSVEPSCSLRAFIPHAERTTRQAYVLAKHMRYFSAANRAWDPDFYETADQSR
ncbi:hypothetical protein DFH09DRAFT_112393 [Mycena vulgaris]|nr:hypothetical protein DFH09DRAFT_112393 [Mycena vulgaris]